MSRLIKRWRAQHEAEQGHYAILAGFEAALRAHRDDRLAEWYDAAEGPEQLALFDWVTDLLEEEAKHE